jgi:UDP-GlcNAc:undecaprenyl-phosphate GlcNAc-1-phosphate transferase
MISYLLIYVLINILLNYFHKTISRLYNLFDFPDGNRKIHKYPTPLLGGLYFIINLSFIFSFFLFEKFIGGNLVPLIDNYFIFFLISYLFYFLGYFDDKYHLNANLKLFCMISLILISLIFDKNLLLADLRISFYPDSVSFGNCSYPITILCFLLFINAFNMLDGLNGQAMTYAIFIFLIFIFNGVIKQITIPLIISSLFFLYLNLKNRTYLGDSGSLILGFILSYIFLKTYNLDNNFFSDEIFLIMCIPGYELLRLAIKRILIKKHAFSADNNHIHHLILRDCNFIKTYFIIQLLLIAPYITYLISKNFYISFILSLVFYSLLINYFSKKNEKKNT